DLLERFQTAKRHEMSYQNPATPRSLDRDSPLSAEEAALWLAEFGELDAAPETKEAFGPGSTLLTDAEIARIQREIDSES
ncbi:MAG: hypothetical protein ACXVBG_23735, partial [Isosphaeraceae bacterium]